MQQSGSVLWQVELKSGRGVWQNTRRRSTHTCPQKRRTTSVSSIGCWTNVQTRPRDQQITNGNRKPWMFPREDGRRAPHVENAGVTHTVTVVYVLLTVFAQHACGLGTLVTSTILCENPISSSAFKNLNKFQINIFALLLQPSACETRAGSNTSATKKCR